MPVSSAPSGLVFNFVSLGIYTLEIIVVDVGCPGDPDQVVHGQLFLVVSHCKCRVARIRVKFRFKEFLLYALS